MTLLDASAVLALVRGEPGADRVQSRVHQARISSVNLGEVIAKFMDWDLSRQDALDWMVQLNLPVVPFSSEMAVETGLLRQSTRKYGLSFGDRACLATARAAGLPVMTADRNWAQLDLNVEIQVIR